MIRRQKMSATVIVVKNESKIKKDNQEKFRARKILA